MQNGAFDLDRAAAGMQSREGGPLGSALKAWLDDVIIPALVAEYIREKKSFASARQTAVNSGEKEAA